MKKPFLFSLFIFSLSYSACPRPETPFYGSYNGEDYKLECYTDRLSYLKVIVTSKKGPFLSGPNGETDGNVYNIHADGSIVAQLNYFFQNRIDFKQKLNPADQENILEIPPRVEGNFFDVKASHKLLSNNKYILVIPGTQKTDISRYFK